MHNPEYVSNYAALCALHIYKLEGERPQLSYCRKRFRPPFPPLRWVPSRPPLPARDPQKQFTSPPCNIQASSVLLILPEWFHLAGSLTTVLRWRFRGLSRRGRLRGTRRGFAFISTASPRNSLSPASTFPTAAGGLLSFAIVASGRGRFGCMTASCVVGIVSSGVGFGIVVTAGRRTRGRGWLGYGLVFPPPRRPGFIRGQAEPLIVAGGLRRRLGGPSLLSG
jgi:hypothetical protein